MVVLLTGGSRGIGKSIKDFFEGYGHIVLSPSKKEMDLSNLENVKIKSSDIIRSKTCIKCLFNTFKHK